MFFDLRSFSNTIYVTTDFTIGISFFCYNFKSQFHRKFTEDDLLDIYIMQLLNSTICFIHKCVLYKRHYVKLNYYMYILSLKKLFSPVLGAM